MKLMMTSVIDENTFAELINANYISIFLYVIYRVRRFTEITEITTEVTEITTEITIEFTKVWFNGVYYTTIYYYKL